MDVHGGQIQPEAAEGMEEDMGVETAAVGDEVTPGWGKALQETTKVVGDVHVGQADRQVRGTRYEIRGKSALRAPVF
jgi:hypothetical protein